MKRGLAQLVLVSILLVNIPTLLSAQGNKNNKNKNKLTPKYGSRITVGDLLNKMKPKPKPKPKPQNNAPRQNAAPARNYAPNANNYNNQNTINSNNALNYQNNAKNFLPTPVSSRGTGKIVPPMQRLPTELPVRTPSWTHCVHTRKVEDAWVVVTSPGHPNKIQSQMQCSWIFEAAVGHRVRVSFGDFDLEPPTSVGCGSQYVEIIDLSLQKAQARFCGSALPGDYVSMGNKLRLDLQADTTDTPFRGFVAAFRQDIEVPGLRDISYYKGGQPGSNYANANNNFNPNINRPPSNPLVRPVPTAPQRRVTWTQPTTQAPTLYSLAMVPGKNIYGANRQPDQENKNAPTEDPNQHLYIIIAVVVVIVLLAGAAYVFRRFFFKKFKAWKKAHDAQSRKADELQGKIYGDKKSLPVAAPPPLPPSNLSRTGSVVTFADDLKFNKTARSSISDDPGIGMTRHGSMTSLHSAASLQDFQHPLPFNGGMTRSLSTSFLPDAKQWNGNSDPVYEDDTMSLRSVSSVRSTNRHPEHESIKRKKILERRQSQISQTGSLASLDLATQQQQQMPTYNTQMPFMNQQMYSQQQMGRSNQGIPSVYNPYNHQDVYGGSLPRMYGMNVMPDNMMGQPPQYGFAPQGMNPMSMPPPYNAINQYPLHQIPMQQPQQHQPLLVLPQQVISTQPQVGDQVQGRAEPIYAPLSDGIGSTMSTSNSYTPADPQWNKMRESVLRSAKSMNDLTAMNTKLNESKSWQLPTGNKVPRTSSMLF